MDAAELWTLPKTCHPGLDNIAETEAEIFSTVQVDMRVWIGRHPAGFLAQLERRASSNGIGAGRGGGPVMERVSAGCYLLLDAGQRSVGGDIESSMREAHKELNTLR